MAVARTPAVDDVDTPQPVKPRLAANGSAVRSAVRGTRKDTKRRLRTFMDGIRTLNKFQSRNDQANTARRCEYGSRALGGIATVGSRSNIGRSTQNYMAHGLTNRLPQRNDSISKLPDATVSSCENTSSFAQRGKFRGVIIA
jgi:hypothetical protein